jgi:hypothetical protein
LRAEWLRFLYRRYYRKGGDAMNWDQIFSRLSVTGVTALLCGALVCLYATKLVRFIFRERGERLVLPVRLAGLALAVFGVIVLLDFIPGL